MQYEASLVHAGEPLLSCQSSDQQQLIRWITSHLDADYGHAVGVIRDQLNTHAPMHIYIHNPHFE